jgi:hypothetical protein
MRIKEMKLPLKKGISLGSLSNIKQKNAVKAAMLNVIIGLTAISKNEFLKTFTTFISKCV